MTALYSILVLPTVFAHMSMQFPAPRDNGGTYYAWQANEPMITAHPQICHGLAADTTVREINQFSAGDTITIDLYGSASHLGGHCTFWYSTDDVTFTKIIDIRDCTLNAQSTQVILPESMPTACTTKCTFAFTWVPRVSGACEIYMNCADISVAGAKGGNTNPITKNFQTSIISAGAGYGCERVDDSTHFTSIFEPLKTEYDDSDISAAETGETVSETVKDTTCWADESLAINLDTDVRSDGVCTDNRCDTGYCCSENGYCGPEFNGVGYIDYGSASDGSVLYSDASTAYASYCVNSIGDWRVVQCAEGNTQIFDGNSGANAVGATFAFVVSLFMMAIC